MATSMKKVSSPRWVTAPRRASKNGVRSFSSAYRIVFEATDPNGKIVKDIYSLFVFDPAAAYPFRVNLVPLKNLLRFDTKRDLLLNLVGNSAMFVPTGIVLPIVYGRLRGFWKTVGAGALISLCIELLQLPFAVRASDADDLILNTLGVAVGYGIYALVRGLIRRGKRGGTER